ncbi:MULTISPECIES: aldehyde dehydrogenase family protein [unclassified Modicisalibacter]|uniref:aldehyde dehydrogenase family protein n=1 Tax=unclassified Modicisalibacter TaxID=2679913 RepID=UPI001CCA2146|nr:MULTISPECIES: aldehyde dehydrogenase family protein [unclassified Modicisalibacter]MBZ9558577.1 aldehyde dehydrogenase family protein [Modicisalibacter sp. R2A 31.J]MBZ9575531.1 aldehyde dehydrogenase family protein [Modicisalibacter sp. MOD 31.J]
MPTQAGQDFYIDGAWQRADTAQRLPVFDPARETPIDDVAAGGRHDVDAAVAAARKAFASWSQVSVDARIALLERIAEGIEARGEQFIEAMIAEMGTSRRFARAAQLPFGLAHVRVQAEILRDYRFRIMQDSTAICREPIGVCGLITPWNWPLYQITAKVAPALAAGCTLVLKPSELSPLSARLFAQVLHDAGVPPGVFNMVTGTGETVGGALAAHPDIDMISITGSTRAGVEVARAAAPTVKRVVQELGGKSPNVFLDDADFANGVAKGVMAGFRNCGQSCSAPTRMIVPRARLEEVEALALAAVAEIVVGDPRHEATVLGPIANGAQYARVQELIQAGIDEGARLLCGGPGRPEGLSTGYFARPTIFSDVTMDMRIAKEEIFGPVLSILTYETEEEAIRIANDTRYGLGAHVQSANQESARRVARQIRAGQVHINYPAWDGKAAFGGYGQSGNGREFGVFGLEEYLEVKSILGY